MQNEKNMKAEKARQLRYKKPIVRNLNIDFIRNSLFEMMDECEEIRWYTESDDGAESLLNNLLGDEDEAYEFRMAFADLCAECEQMLNDLHDAWIPECFDTFFAAISDGSDEILGFDSYEGDYFGLGAIESSWGIDEAKKKLLTLKKEDIIDASRTCFKVYHAYIGLSTRYDSLKAAIDILRDRNNGILKTVKEIERIYEDVQKNRLDCISDGSSWKKFDLFTASLPSEAWIA